MNLKKIKRAIISVSDKSKLNALLPILKKLNIEIISTGGTFKKIQDMKYKCKEVSSYTGLPEMLEGRVKTLNPKIHAGILNIRKNKKHQKELKKQKISQIDLIIVNLYPFEKKMEKKVMKNLIEYIDIGGPTLIRSAAKNFNDVTIISNPNDYQLLIEELRKYKGSTSLKFREFMSAKAFGQTAYYDSVISNYFNEKLNIKFPEKKTIHGELKEHLHYGENPHQKSCLYSNEQNSSLLKLNGKNLSYNNYNDIYSAISILNIFNKNEGTVIIKHANPCGVSSEKNQIKSFKSALDCDPISAFGGIVAINSIVRKKLALELNKIFFEAVIAKGFEKNALKILKRKKNIRLIDFSKYIEKNNYNYLFLGNSFLIQNSNNILFNKKIRIVSKKKPTLNQLKTMKFAFSVCKFVKSNAIVLANNKSIIGIGSGQPSRLDSCKIASNKALEFLPEKIMESVAASDAFFPFPDGIEHLAELGVKAIIQPGGSINDKKIIEAANKSGLVMAFTNIRHFKH